MITIFKADNGAQFVFYREHATEYVRVTSPSQAEEVFTLEQFIFAIRKIQKGRAK